MKDWQIKLNKLFKVKHGPPSDIEERFIKSAVNNIKTINGLDAGCGRMSILGKLASQGSLIIGIDIDEDTLRSNTDIKAGVIGSLEDLPFKNEIFDVINCRWVIEHLKKPDQTFKEFNRILKPNGYLSLWTVNIMNYVIMVSKLTSTSFHNFYRKKFMKVEFDNVPTYYKANIPWKLDLMLRKGGFKQQKLNLHGGAYLYLKFSKLTYLIGLLLNKLTEFGFLKYLRLYIIGLYKKSKTESLMNF